MIEIFSWLMKCRAHTQEGCLTRFVTSRDTIELNGNGGHMAGDSLFDVMRTAAAAVAVAAAAAAAAVDKLKVDFARKRPD